MFIETFIIMIQEIVRTERGLNGIIHKYISHIEIPDEILKPKKKSKKTNESK